MNNFDPGTGLRQFTFKLNIKTQNPVPSARTALNNCWANWDLSVLQDTGFIPLLEHLKTTQNIRAAAVKSTKVVFPPLELHLNYFQPTGICWFHSLVKLDWNLTLFQRKSLQIIQTHFKIAFSRTFLRMHFQ